MANGDEPTLIRVLSEIDVETFWRLRLRALQEEPESFCATYEESVETSLEEVAQKLKSSDESFIFIHGISVIWHRTSGVEAW